MFQYEEEDSSMDLKTASPLILEFDAPDGAC